MLSKYTKGKYSVKREKMTFPNENNSKRLLKKDYSKCVDRVWGNHKE